MRTTLYLLLTSFTLLLSLDSFSQAICGFDGAHHQKMQDDPTYRRNVLAGEAAIRTYLQQHPRTKPAPGTITIDKTGSPTTTLGSPSLLGGGPYQIPVVVHVIHTGGAIGTIYNPTDTQILDAINYLNSVYNGTWVDSAQGGMQGAGDLGIQFVLAKRDPNCNPTNGINRVDGSSVSGYVSGGVRRSTSTGTPDINIKNLSRWDNTMYYNVWIVNKIDGNDGTSGTFVAGYAYLPGAPATDDGIVMLSTQMVAGQKTLPHEIGHAFNLYHPFEGSTDSTMCPSNIDCTSNGDQVCDTDPISYNLGPVTGILHFDCRSGTNPCASPAGTQYSANTESNFMNYTNCYTLFTAGQRDRMQASAAGSYRSPLSSSLGGTTPNAGATPCTPKIDFEITDDQVTEATSATSGCRAYKDYTYNMVIGSGPSVTATATLSVTSGTATQGLDFDVTTNGSFTTPSSILSFPAGSITSRSFIIRVYDDASINGTRKFTLGFTVNNGGGNTVAGDGRPNFTMTIYDNDQAPAAGTTLGTANVGSLGFAGSSLFDATQKSQKVQFLYKAAELTAAGIPAGRLTGLSLYVYQKHSTRNYTNLNISMASTTTTYLRDLGGNVNQEVSVTLVKSLASYNTTAGWNTFTFDNPFTWDGTSNLVIQVCNDNGSAAPSDVADVIGLYSDGGVMGQGNLIFQDGIDCSQILSSVIYNDKGIKPILKLAYGTPPTVVQTVLNTSKQQFLGPNADVYFYDQANGQLMARIQNLNTFNYGCTQVIIDRSGSNATAFWNNNTPNYLMDKTFHVLPTTNNPSGSYTITLFYTQAEVNGWQTATSQSISGIQLVKVPNQISDVTPANPTGGGTVTIVSPAISTLGTNTGLTYNFTNGFSGFGAGIPGLNPLPLGLLDFEGELKNNNTRLDWSTSFESGTKGFEIDRSYDGTNFSSIGFVTAAGNSSTTRTYSFTDPSIAQENNYYRLKEIDLDNKFTYSKVILVKNPNLTTKSFTVLSNPFADHIDVVFGQLPVGKVGIRLLDMTGKVLLSRSGASSAGSRMRIDLSGSSISAGIYLLELRFNNSIQIQKLLKN